MLWPARPAVVPPPVSRWRFFSSQNPSSTLSSAVSQLEVLIVRLRQLRRIADEHGGKFRSDGLATFFRTVQRELDDDYFDTLAGHLKLLRFRDGELLSAQLSRDNSGINYVLRSGLTKRSWRERMGSRRERSIPSRSRPATRPEARH